MYEHRETAEHLVNIPKLVLAALPPTTTDAVMFDESRRDPMISPPSPAAPTLPVQRSGRWTPDEKILFLYGLKRFGKGRWKKMSVYLPHRSLVQIKSHAQKVLKRLEAGENIFRRLDENISVIDSLIVQAAKQRDAIMRAPVPKSIAAKQKKMMDEDDANRSTQEGFSQVFADGSPPLQSPVVDGDVAALAASALCQLSSL